MKRADWTFAAVILALGAGYLAMAWKMPRGTLAFPGPGFYPVLVGFMLVLTSLAYLSWEALQVLRAGAPAAAARAAAPAPARRVPRFLQLVGAMVAYVLALYYLGYLIAITLLLVLSIGMFGYRRPLGTAAITAAVVGVSYLLFIYWLKVPLPKGSLWQ